MRQISNNDPDGSLAETAALKIVWQFVDQTSICTEDYQLCDFIVAAAQVAMLDPNVARRIGGYMQAERIQPVEPFIQDPDEPFPYP